MADTISYRRPDDEGYFLHDFSDYQIGLSHKRPSIMDFSSHGCEPMTFQDLVIIYDGEIYNYLEIRKELIFFYEFASQTDTEVTLKQQF